MMRKDKNKIISNVENHRVYLDGWYATERTILSYSLTLKLVGFSAKLLKFQSMNHHGLAIRIWDKSSSFECSPFRLQSISKIFLIIDIQFSCQYSHYFNSQFFNVEFLWDMAPISSSFDYSGIDGKEYVYL